MNQFRESVRGEMPIYSFKLRSDENVFADDAGVSLPNPKLAYHYACDVVRELMRHRESETGLWRSTSNRREKFSIFPLQRSTPPSKPFPENWRRVVEQLWQRVRSLQGALS